MISIKGTNITMNRSDSVFITVTVRDSQGRIYDLQEFDELIFSAKKKSTDENYAIAPKPLIRKKAEDGDYHVGVLEISTADTEHLAFGTYLYDVRLKTVQGYSSTIIKPSNLVIEESITGAGDY